MENSASSKVTVEYHDPSGVFSLVAEEITARLPLQNLNWHSPPRPLRQIKSLHVDFVPDKETAEALRPTLDKEEVHAQPSSLEIVRSGQDGRKHATKERRHQIPGFKTSPYLRIYVLRCDDVAGYKESERKSIREWVKANASAEGKSQNHDACEWLILHVVIPGTAAANEPRWRESSADELKERSKNKTKWPGKGDRTVFDRLRSDFNESGKAALDRVAQIRISKDRIAPDLLPTPAIAPSLVESPQEHENALSDIISKFKILILGPFDRRVRQYEADIAEQEARRSLPGWNFCTFFIHKEGLAKALESVGLVEDALAIYDELSLDLETVLREMALDSNPGAATSFASFTDDIEVRITGDEDETANDMNDDMINEGPRATSLFNKDYREKIVRSDISIFDFLCYIFSRQKALILRLANTRSARKELGRDSKDGGEDLVLTSEVCWRASSFIHNTSRVLRLDLAQAVESGRSRYGRNDIDSLVCSWTYAVAGLVLAETAVPVLLEAVQFDHTKRAHTPNERSRRSTMGFALGANPYPQRISSLKMGRMSVPPDLLHALPHLAALDNKTSRSNDGSIDEAMAPGNLPGQAELATYRAELISLRRRMLEHVGAQHGYFAGWACINRSLIKAVDLTNAEIDRKSPSLSSNLEEASLLLSPSFKAALQDEATFFARFARLTDAGIRHFLTATQNKSAERLMGDVALLKHQQKDYVAAAAYFERIVPLYSADGWDLMESKVALVYADCLKQLRRTPAQVAILLALITKQCSKFDVDPQASHHGEPRQARALADDSGLDPSWLLREAIAASMDLDEDVSRPADGYFSTLQVRRRVQNQHASDALAITLQLGHIMHDDIEVDEIVATMVSVDDPGQMVHFRSEGATQIRPGANEIDLVTTIMSYGPYTVEKVTIRLGKISFVQGFESKGVQTTSDTAGESGGPTKPPLLHPPQCLFIFPRKDAFRVEVQRANHITIDKPRHVVLTMYAGNNEIEALGVTIRPASAGLRVQSGDFTHEGIQPVANTNADFGQHSIGSLQAGSTAKLSFPYTSEQVCRDIAIRYEIQYQVSGVRYTLSGSERILNELPLDVEVHDVFHLSTLYSNFTVRATDLAPSVVLGYMLNDSPVYAVDTPLDCPLPLTVSRSRPINLVSKITTKSDYDKKIRKKEAALALSIDYIPIEEVVLWCARQQLIMDLQQSTFADSSRLLDLIFVQRLKQVMHTLDLDLIALVQTFQLPSYEAIHWAEVLVLLPDCVQGGLEAWLRAWHDNHATINCMASSEMQAIVQKITIAVDIPNVDIVFHAALDLVLEDNSGRLVGPPVLALGRPIKAKLRVAHSGIWAAKRLFPHVPKVKIQGDGEEDNAFVCEVGADSDVWLIAGKRRFCFRPEDSPVQEQELELIPLQLGTQALPLVDVQVALASTDGGAAVSCEVHYESAAQLVQVVHDARTSSISIVETPAISGELPSRPNSSSGKEVA